MSKSRSAFHLLLRILTPLFLLAAPAFLVLAALRDIKGVLPISFALVCMALLLFFLRRECKPPKVREILPIVVLAAVAAGGRVLFSALPNFKPVTAVVIIAALVYGPESGFLTGALAALAGNMFFGQGAWTPWQMYAWGLIGYLAGLTRRLPLLRKRLPLMLLGALLSLVYGLVMDTWSVVSYLNPDSAGALTAVYGAGLAFNLSHAASTFVFLGLFAGWRTRLEALQSRYPGSDPAHEDKRDFVWR